MLGIHQDIRIDVCQKMKKKRQKNYGYKHKNFLTIEIWSLLNPKNIYKHDQLDSNNS